MLRPALKRCARCTLTCIVTYPANRGQVQLCGFCVDLAPGEEPPANGYTYDAATRQVTVAGRLDAVAGPARAPVAPPPPAPPVSREALDEAWAEQRREVFPHDVPAIAPPGASRQVPACFNCQNGRRAGKAWRCEAGLAAICAPYGEASAWSFVEEPAGAPC